MKTKNNQILKPVSKTELEMLTRQVEETLAAQPIVSQITAAQVWDIQRRGRRAWYRRPVFF